MQQSFRQFLDRLRDCGTSDALTLPAFLQALLCWMSCPMPRSYVGAGFVRQSASGGAPA